MSSTKEEVHKVIGQLQKEGIENILALRGDIPQDGQFPLPGQYSHACELIEDIKKMGDFCIGAACYPEGHVEMEHKKDDIRYLKEKVDCGVDFITTQMFFNNDIFYNFLYRIREQGIMIPVLPGIMPITTKKQLARSCALSGTAVPQLSLIHILEKTNIRYVQPEDLGEPIDFSSIDVSFISLTKVLLPIRNYLKENGEIVALIKPQFEAGREKVGKKGVVREKSTHIEVIEKVTDYAVSVSYTHLDVYKRQGLPEPDHGGDGVQCDGRRKETPPNADAGDIPPFRRRRKRNRAVYGSNGDDPYLFPGA